jgi:sialidase-1
MLPIALALLVSGGLEQMDLFSSNSGGYAHFRIPGLVTTSKGSLLAYAEARKSLRGDWGAIDIVMRRSADKGRTWSPQRLIAKVAGPVGKNPVALAKNLAVAGELTYNNPVAIADRKSGVVHFLFCLEYMRAFYMRSEDDGQTFSDPIEITKAFDRFRPEYDWKVLAMGPGHGIQLKNGRLLVPVWLSLGTGASAHRPSVTSTIYSDDGGKTWNRGAIAVPDTEDLVYPNETAAAQLSNGMVMLNVRSESKANRRIVVLSKDGASGWSQPRFDQSLAEPICFASLLSLGRKGLVFSNPDHLEKGGSAAKPGQSRDRKNLTVQWSPDNGQTWKAKRVIEPGWSGYSDLAAGPDGTIYCFYEWCNPGASTFQVASLKLASFSLSWLKQ